MATTQYTKDIFRAENRPLYKFCFCKEILVTIFLLFAFEELLAIPECIDIRKDICQRLEIDPGNYMRWTNHTQNTTYLSGFDEYRLNSVPNKILGIYYDPSVGRHPYDSLKKKWEIPQEDSHANPIYHDLKDYHRKSGNLQSFTLNTDLFGNKASYNDAQSLFTNYTIKNKIYLDSHGDGLIPVTEVNPLSFPVIRNYTEQAHQFFFTRVITNFNVIPKMLNVKSINHTYIGKTTQRYFR